MDDFSAELEASFKKIEEEKSAIFQIYWNFDHPMKMEEEGRKMKKR